MYIHTDTDTHTHIYIYTYIYIHLSISLYYIHIYYHLRSDHGPLEIDILLKRFPPHELDARPAPGQQETHHRVEHGRLDGDAVAVPLVHPVDNAAVAARLIKERVSL